MTDTMNLQMLMLPVAAIEPALTFYRQVLGLPLRFRDGDRYAALDAGGITLALCAGAERLAETAMPVFRVQGIDESVERLLAAGATIRRAIENGPHERRAVLDIPGGGGLLLSEKLNGESA